MLFDHKLSSADGIIGILDIQVGLFFARNAEIGGVLLGPRR
jgi:hypothetical protein